MDHLYSEYLEVHANFTSVFTEEVDRSDPSAWISFIPHEGMINLLSSTLRAMERSTPDDRKSIWLYGPYGTGKTFAAFVLKHVLEDNLDTVKEYFQAHNLPDDLFERVSGLRQTDRPVVVYRSSTGTISSVFRLLGEIQYALKAALAGRGYTNLGTKTLYEQVISKLKDPSTTFSWDKAFSKHRELFPDYPSPVSVLDRLAASADGDLLDRVYRVLDEERFMVLDSPDVVKKWIGEVVRANNIPGVVFVWDEFTDFFNSGLPLSPLQELAHLSAEVPFYLMLITHRSPQLLRRGGDEDWRKLEDRFVMMQYEMKPVTAYQLISRAIRVKVDAANAWSDLRANLWSRVEKVARDLAVSDPGTQAADFVGLIPLHPYTAFLLSLISRLYSSSQRTLFRFLNQRGILSGFPDFLSSHPSDKWYWLTADNLWDYFLLSESTELRQRVRESVTYFRSKEGLLQSQDSKRVLKGICLLIALSNELSGDERVKPRLSSLRAIFAGTPIQDDLQLHVDSLRDAGVVRQVKGPWGDEFTIPLGQIDERALESIRSSLPSFESMVRDSVKPHGAKLRQAFQPPFGLASRRCAVTLCSAVEFQRRRDRLLPHHEGYQLGLLVVLAQQEKELDNALKMAQELTITAAENAVIAVTSRPMTQDRWEAFQTELSYAAYYRDRQDEHNSRYHRERSERILNDWTQELRSSSIQLSYSGLMQIAYGMEGLARVLLDIAAEVFPYSIDSLSTTQTLYEERYGAKGAEVGLGIGGALINPYKTMIEELTARGIVTGEGTINQNLAEPHPLRRMQSVVDSYFEAEVVPLNRIWETLRKAPYGVIPSPLGIFTMALLLRCYSEGFYWTDGTNFFALNANKMADLVLHTMKGDGTYSIHRLTPEARSLCELLGRVFRLDDDSVAYPERARDSIRLYLKRQGYPMWAALGCIQTGSRDQEAATQTARLVSRLDDFVRNQEVGQETDGIRDMCVLLGALETDLANLVSRDALEQGLTQRTKQLKPTLYGLVDGHIPWSVVFARLRELMNEDAWLWTESSVCQGLESLSQETRIITAVASIFSERLLTLEDVCTLVKNKIRFARIPLSVFSLAEPDLDVIVTHLSNLCSDPKSFRDAPQLAELLDSQGLGLSRALANPKSILGRYVSSVHSVDLTEAECSTVWVNLPQGSEADETRFATVVETYIRDLSRQRLVDEIRKEFRAVSGSETTAHWEDNNRIPIAWVIDDEQEMVHLVSMMRDLSKHSLVILQYVVHTLREYQERLRFLSDKGAVLNRFLRQFVHSDHLKQLSAHEGAILLQTVVESQGVVINRWGKPGVQDRVNTWLAEHYDRYLKPRVLSIIEHMPHSQAQQTLRGAADQPRVGLWILTWSHEE